ncbi:MAG: DUF5011 domain-containing protein [Patescibacteria group bacterium]|nr:DUF5011 domain-containing protein [Patescibacteria group bacterium]
MTNNIFINNKPKILKQGSFIILAAMLIVSGFFISNALAVTGITVTSPINGEYWNETQNITWTANCEGGDTVNIYYSTDNFGNVSDRLADSVPCSNYLYPWDTTEVADGNAYIKVRDTFDSDVYNVSGVFTIDNIDPTVDASAITSPIGGEFWAGAVSKDITWDATKINDTNLEDNPISLHYTTDNGATWNTIEEGLANTSPYSWTVPAINSETVKVKIVVADLAGNTASDESDVDFRIDSIKPETSLITPNLTQITDVDAGFGTFTVTINYNEAMDQTSVPIITFTPEVSSTLSFNNGGSWLNSNIYEFTYDVTDASIEVVDVDISVSGATDVAGNIQVDGNLSNAFDIDALNPIIVSAIANPNPAKAGDVVITVLFSEIMDAVTPTLGFTGITETITTKNDGVWPSGTTWIETFTLSDNNKEETVTISVTGAKDVAGNVMVVDNEAGNFKVDTVDPIVTTITPSINLITDDTTISTVFTVAIGYNETMNSDSVPIIVFDPIIESTLTLVSNLWSNSNKTYTATYNMADAGVEMNYINVSVSGATDVAGNIQVDGNLSNAFDIDTKNPTVILSDDHPDNIVRDANIVRITATFTEANNIDETPMPAITIGSIVTGAAMTETNNLVWTYTWDVPSSNDVDVDISITAIDVAGNPNDTATGKTSYIIDNIAPTVALTYNPNRPVRDDDTIEITATFNEPMVSAPTIAIDTTDTDLIETAMSGSGMVWTHQYDVPAGSDGNATVMILGTDIAGNPNETATNNTFIIDNIAPVITLSGNISVEIETGETYTDAGATAEDNTDGNITANIIIVNPVDTSMVGTYTITYNIKDSAGNNATEVTRKVNVVFPTLIHMTASDVSRKQDLEFIVEINSKGNVRDSQNDHLVRFYGVIPGLDIGQITFLGDNIPAEVTDATERSYVSAGADDLVLAWGPEGGFLIGDAETAYESDVGLTTTFKAKISEVGVYDIKFVFYDIDDKKKINGDNEKMQLTILDDATNLQMTSEGATAKQNAEFSLTVTTQGNVKDTEKDNLVRFYGVIPGLAVNEIIFSGDNIPAEVTDATERSYVSAGAGDLVLAWGPEGGFLIGVNESDYESANGLSTTFNAKIGKQANYIISFKMYDFTKGVVSAVGSTNLDITDGVAPTGYTVAIDQSYINNSNQTALSFIFTGAEENASYNYSIESSVGGTTITSTGTITATNQQIININVTGLNDGTLTLTVYLTDQVDNQGDAVTDTVVKDTIVPTTSDNYVAKDNIWQSEDQTITLTPTDAMSGVTTTKYCTDTNNNCDPATDYVNPVIISDEGITYLRYASTDNAGNVQETVSRTVKIDKKAPATIDNVPASWQAVDVTVTLSCDDTAGGNSGCLKVYYTIDTTNPTTASSFVDEDSNWQFTVSTDGKYAIKYRGEDNAGNLEEIKTASDTLQLDKTAPATTDDASTDWQNTNVIFTLTANDDTSGVATVYYCVDQANACTPNTAGTEVLVTTEGTNYVRYYSTDNAGNNEEINSVTVLLDKTTPSTSDNTPLEWQTATFDIILTVTNDELSPIKTYYTTDGNNPTTDSAQGTIIDISLDGEYSIKYFTADAAGNTETVKIATNLAKLDATAPELQEVTPVSTLTNDSTPDYTFSSDETGAITYGGSCLSATASAIIGENAITFNELEDGTYSDCTITVTDSAGNASTELSVTEFVVDSTAPEITNLTPELHDTTSDATPEISAQFNENGSGVNINSVGLTFSGDEYADDYATKSTASVTYTPQIPLNPNTYEATVTVADNAGNSTTKIWSFIVNPTIASITVSSNKASLPADGTSQALIIAQVLDNGIPVEGAVVNFAAIIGTLSNITLSDINGRATAVLTSNEAGQTIVTASYNSNNGLIQGTINVSLTEVMMDMTPDPVTTYNIPLSAGWNLISLPLIPESSVIEDVLADISTNIDTVKYYDPSIEDWLSYIPGIGGDLITMEDGKGYWIFMKDDDDILTVNGVEMPGPEETLPTYPVISGWNLIGFKSVDSVKSSTYLSGISYITVYGYDGNYSTVAHPVSGIDNNMNPGSGYWLYANAIGNIVP